MTTATEKTIAVAGGVQLFIDVSDPTNYRLKVRIDGVDTELVQNTLDKDNNFTIKLADTTGVAGKTLAIKGSDTGIGLIGGQVRLQSGRGSDSNGVVFSEGEGNPDFFQAFWEGGQSPIVTVVGTGGGTPVLKFQQGDGNIQGTGGIYIDALGSYMFLRIGAGTAVIARLGPAGMRLSTDAAVPVEKLEVDGKIQFKAVAVPGGNPPAGNFWLYMSSADNKLYCKGPSGTVTPLGNP